MKSAPFPGCCTAKTLIGFDSIETMQWDLQGNVPTKDQLMSYCKEYKIQGIGILVAILTNTQKKGLKVLKECGFTRTRAISKSHHPETKLILLWKALDRL